MSKLLVGRKLAGDVDTTGCMACSFRLSWLEKLQVKVGQLMKTESIAHHKMLLAEGVFWSILGKIDEIISSNDEVLAKSLWAIWHQERFTNKKVRQFMDLRNEGVLSAQVASERWTLLRTAGSSCTDV